MIPGNDGSVISNKDIFGGGGGVVVYNNVINNSSAHVSSSARDNGDGSVTIETIVSDIENNGPIGQSIGRNYNANRRATE
uniref:Tail length tape measure protein n=1 Tax=Salmonella phage vB_STmST19_KE13 TaxID=3161167 RepID=A0AAU8GFR7_9CAUD